MSFDEKPVVEHSPRISDAERDLAANGENKAVLGLEDPDAGLSEEERAKIVCADARGVLVAFSLLQD